MHLYSEINSNLLNKYNIEKTFGFFVSGGFDSALLLYMSCNLKQMNNLPCTFKVFTVPRYDDSAIHALRIINWISNIFPLDRNITEIGDPSLHHGSQVSSGFIEAQKQCDFIVLGDTKNPDHMTELYDAPKRGTSKAYPLYQPFYELTKQDTVAFANELGILNDVAAISHSCVRSKLLRCTECWQCRERAWGFQQNNFVDIGIM